MSLSNYEKAKRGELHKALILFTLNVSRTCEYLGISRSTYYRNAKKWGLEKPVNEPTV